MTGTNEGTSAAVADTPKPDAKAEMLADFTEALKGYGNPDATKSDPTEARKAETKAAEPPPAKETETPPVPDVEKAKDAPKPPNFDALPDSLRSTFDKIAKGEALSDDERAALVAEVPKGYLRQSDYTKKRMAEKAVADKLKAQLEANEEILSATKRVLSTPAKHKRFLAMADETDEAAPTPVEVDLSQLEPKDQAQAIRDQAKAVLTEAERAKQETSATEAKAEAALKSAASEWYDTVKTDLTPEEGEALLKVVTNEWERDEVDPLSVRPSRLVSRLSELAETYTTKKRLTELEAKLSKKQADAARSANASSKPNGRVPAPVEFDLRNPADRLKKSMADLGIEDWNKDVAFGNRGPEMAV